MPKRSRGGDGPGRLARLGRWATRWVPPCAREHLWFFWVRSRLLVSRTVLVIVAALLAWFAWDTIQKQTYELPAVYESLLMQSMALAALIHMNLWESEREGRTFELLIMRIPTPHRLIWFKLSVSLFWTLVLMLPFVVGYVWFASVPLGRALVCFVFIAMTTVLVALFTCIVSSFVHRGLPTLIIAVFVTLMVSGILTEGELPWKNYYQIFVYPFHEAFEAMPDRVRWRYLIVNRLVTVGVGVGLYWWLHQRISKLEKWVR